MQYSSFVVIAAWFVTTVWCDDLTDFLNNTSKTNELRCAQPQKRAIYLRELVSEEVWKNTYKQDVKHIIPYATVLGRCDEHAGCCKNYNERCGPVKDEKILLTFGNFEGSNAIYHKIWAINHLECGCKKINDKLIK